MDLAHRIKQFREGLRLSQSEFARRAGISLGSLKKYEGGKRAPGSGALAAIGRTGVNFNWLMTGFGRMLIDAVEQTLEPDADRYVAIPIIDVRASAVGAMTVESEQVVDVLHFKREWIYSELRASPADLKLVFVDGESMEPMLRTGGIILVNIRDQMPKRDGIYVLWIDDALLVKRLQTLPGHRLRVSSDNPAYEPFELRLPLEPKGAAIVGRVVWMGCRV